MEPIYQADRDEEMNAAIEKARDTFPEFLREAEADFGRIIPVLEGALVKIEFVDPDDDAVVEHLWARYLGRDEEDEGQYVAVMLSSPAKLAHIVENGDEFSFTTDNLTDWLYVVDGKARGAFTVQLLRSRMSPAERKKHDAAYPFSF